MSIFFHIDVNSAFLSWTALEMLENGSEIDIRTIPAIVGGDTNTRHGIVLAKSIPAKAYGIQTAEPVVNAYRKCPNLTMVPPNHVMYQERSHALMQYLSSICPDIDQVSIDECYMDYTPIADKYPSPESAAHFIKDSVLERFGFTVNVGISDRKVLAKMASDFKKPNLVHTLYSHEIQTKLWPMPVSSLFLCGHSSAETLHKLGIITIGDLAHAQVDILQAHLKSHGLTLWEYANGIDSSGITPEPVKMKGIGNSTTLTRDAENREEAFHTLLQLAESVGRRVRADHMLAGMVSTEIKYASFQSVSHQTTLEKPSASTDVIYQTACKLFDELWNGSPIRLLGIRTSKLVPDTEPQQMSLFDYQQAAPVSEKQQKLDSALDSLRSKYGKDIIKRGSLLDSPSKTSNID
ncbi:MAG: DNA polymerase IV [Lachnospiraceae bacterium]|nr:DNA polymerase IV [Lachnospiraceae bacterium]MBQ7777077.1 DNA polymerase IV [Lachnospiraceae bacterium]